jgi:hypothetical protein
MQQGIALMRANMQYITDSSSTKRAFCRSGRDVFSRGFEGGCPFRRRRPNPVEIPETRRHPARRLRRGLSGPRRGTRPSRPGQAGRVKILQKAALIQLEGRGSPRLSLSLISVICYLLSREGPRAIKIILLRPTSAYSSHGRYAICQPADSHSLCRPCQTAPHAPTSDFLVAPVLPRIPDPPPGAST